MSPKNTDKDASSIGDLLPQPPSRIVTRDTKIEVIDYRSGNVPAYVRELVAAHMAMEEDAMSAGAIGYMARGLVNASMPYKDPKADVFKRENGNYSLRIVAGYEGGIPYGVYPRLLMLWITSEAKRTGSPVIELGESLSQFLRNVLELKNITGGPRGTGTRVVEQMKRLFGAMVTLRYEEKKTGAKGQTRNFALNNILIADSVRLRDADGYDLWEPQRPEDAGAWKSNVRLNANFFKEIVDRPVPLDVRGYKALRGSPLAMDLYVWLGYRMSYLQRRTWPIPWEVLMMQFGSGYATSEQGIRDFKKNFLTALKKVTVIYDQLRFEVTPRGIVLKPSPTPIAQTPSALVQRELFTSK